MSESNVSLNDRLAVVLDSMEEAQQTLQVERVEWAKERALLQQEMEQERAEFAKTRDELVQALQAAAQRSVTGLVAAAAQLLAKEAGEGLRARIGAELTRAETNLSTAATKGKEAADRLGLIAHGLKVTWKTSLERTFIQVLPTSMVLAIVGGIISLRLYSDADIAKQQMLEWTEVHAKAVQEHKQMKTEMDVWKQAGIDEVELVPCAGIVPGLCIRVDKKRGALGPNKDLFVPAKP